MTRPPPLLAFSDDCAGLAVSFAVFDFGRQLLVWAAPEGRDETLLGALALGAPAPSSSSAAAAAAAASSTCSSPRRDATATTLLRGSSAGREDEVSVSLARRLAARLGRPVAVAWNLPSLSAGASSSSSAGGGTSADAAALHAWAERRLLAELDRAGMLPATAAAAAAAAGK